MNYATQVGKPTAHITKKKSRLKVYNGHIVFLNDKDNFEFEIHNPKQHPVLCKIKLNGEYISNSGVVLKPGQRVFLERFLDSNNKFEFSTYEVKDTPQNRSAIDLNGDVLVEFYDEQRTRTYSNGTGWITTSNPLGNNNMYTVTNTGTPYLGGLTYTTSSVGSSTLTTAYANYTSTVETGRVEKGGISDQSFTNSYEEFNYFTSHTVKFKILPLSTKNKNVEEIRQYCTECGTKVKKNYKFCPSCGNKI
jgi:hypothetical protein